MSSLFQNLQQKRTLYDVYTDEQQSKSPGHKQQPNQGGQRKILIMSDHESIFLNKNNDETLEDSTIESQIINTGFQKCDTNESYSGQLMPYHERTNNQIFQNCSIQRCKTRVIFSPLYDELLIQFQIGGSQNENTKSILVDLLTLNEDWLYRHYKNYSGLTVSQHTPSIFKLDTYPLFGIFQKIIQQKYNYKIQIDFPQGTPAVIVNDAFNTQLINITSEEAANNDYNTQDITVNFKFGAEVKYFSQDIFEDENGMHSEGVKNQKFIDEITHSQQNSKKQIKGNKISRKINIQSIDFWGVD